MTMTDIEIGEALEIQLGDEVPHVACCQLDRFLCGRQYHPEAQATEDDAEEDCCRTCIDVMYDMLCPKVRPTHSHCPIPGPLFGMLCPRAR